MPRSARRTEPLTRPEIARAALGIVDADGLSALTMRSLGQVLHCDPMAVYHHVHNRDELLSLVAQCVLEEISLPSARLSDRRWLIDLAGQVRSAMHRHSNAASLLGHSQVSAGIGFEVIDAMVERLDRHPQRVAMVDRLNALIGAIVGYVSLELSPPLAMARPASLDGHDDCAHLHRHASELLGHTFGMRGAGPQIVVLPGGFDLMIAILVDGLLAEG
jgi:AcrR family transcriptional regulator